MKALRVFVSAFIFFLFVVAFSSFSRSLRDDLVGLVCVAAHSDVEFSARTISMALAKISAR